MPGPPQVQAFNPSVVFLAPANFLSFGCFVFFVLITIYVIVHGYCLSLMLLCVAQVVQVLKV